MFLDSLLSNSSNEFLGMLIPTPQSLCRFGTQQGWIAPGQSICTSWGFSASQGLLWLGRGAWTTLCPKGSNHRNIGLEETMKK